MFSVLAIIVSLLRNSQQFSFHLIGYRCSLKLAQKAFMFHRIQIQQIRILIWIPCTNCIQWHIAFTYSSYCCCCYYYYLCFLMSFYFVFITKFCVYVHSVFIWMDSYAYPSQVILGVIKYHSHLFIQAIVIIIVLIH